MTLGNAEVVVVVVVGDTVEENCPGASNDDEEAAELMRALLTGWDMAEHYPNHLADSEWQIGSNACH